MTYSVFGGTLSLTQSINHVLSTGSGVIGLSFVPSVGPRQHRGGICEKRDTYGASSMLDPGRYSLNAILISQNSGGRRLVDAITSLTVTHEIGHSFGAYHDNDFSGQPGCMPGEDSPHGNYVMAANVPQKTGLAHTLMFSVCSRRSMAAVTAHPHNTRCLIARSSEYCGNGVVENDEQCDCGTTYTCDVYDKCCVPVSLNPGFKAKTACRLRSSSACSPRVHLCCTSSCTVTSANVICRQETDCASASHCDGRSASCPAPRLVVDGTPCAGGRGRCKAGVCSVSVCEQAGLVDCLCRQPQNHACSLCCRCSDAPQDACVPAQWLHLAPQSYTSHSLLLAPGATCAHRGVCNNDARCVTRKTWAAAVAGN